RGASRNPKLPGNLSQPTTGKGAAGRASAKRDRLRERLWGNQAGSENDGAGASALEQVTGVGCQVSGLGCQVLGGLDLARGFGAAACSRFLFVGRDTATCKLR